MNSPSGTGRTWFSPDFPNHEWCWTPHWHCSRARVSSIGYQPLRRQLSCYLKERDLYGWKCQDARAAVSELSVLVAHFDDHFETSFWFRSRNCVCCEGGELEREGENETKIRKFKNKKKFDLQKVKNREKRERNRVLSSNSFNINVPQCNLILRSENRSQSLHWYWIEWSDDVVVTGKAFTSAI